MEKKTLLVIEDNEINRHTLVGILQDKYYVLTAVNGRDGLEILRKHGQCISAVLLDIQMPVMNGYEFLEYVGQDSVFCKIPVIVTTVLDSSDDEKRCLELGAVDFISKPYNALVVKLRVENTIFLRECSGIISELEMDALTGFKNRRAYHNEIMAIEQDSEKSEHSVGVIFADINGLKEVNDNSGHVAGDDLIASVARSLTSVFPEAKRYRIGGDEFIILSFDENEDDFNKKLDRLSELWNNEYSASVGAVWMEHARDLENGVADADKMMYMEKSRYYEDRIHIRRKSLNVVTQEDLEKVESVADLLPGGFFVYRADSSEELITFNKELLRLFKCSNKREFSELTGNSFKGMVHPDDLQVVEGDISSQIKQERDIDRVKYRIVCRDGTEKKVLDYGRFVHTDKYGDVYYVFLNDMTE